MFRVLTNAGEIVSRAWLAVFSGHQRCYSTMTDALAGSPYFSTYMGDSSQTVVQLNIKLLLLEAASEVQYGSNPHIDASAISCTVQQLLQHVQCSLWDTNNRQLHVVRQALALHIVQDVNMGRPLHSNAVAHRDAYSLRRSRAGEVAALELGTQHTATHMIMPSHRLLNTLQHTVIMPSHR